MTAATLDEATEPDHGRDDRAGGRAPPGATAGSALRPAGRAADGGPRDRRDAADRSGPDRGDGLRLLGHGLRHGAVRRRETRSPCGPGAPELAAMINTEHRNVDYFPTIALPDDPARGQRSRRGDGRCRLRGPRRAVPVAARQSRPVADSRRRRSWSAWPRASNWAPGLRMSQVIAEAGAIEAERIAVVTGPNLAREIAERQPSASVVASVGPGHRGGAAGGVPHRALPGLHQHRRGGLRARRARPRT